MAQFPHGTIPAPPTTEPSLQIPNNVQTKQIIIQGHAFVVPVPFSEGHVLSGGEASAMNQVFHENLRNNFASRIKKLEGDGAIDISSLQNELDEYAVEYEFGVRQSATAADPVEREAMKLARQAVKAALKNANREESKDWIEEAAGRQIEKNPIYMAKARIIVEARQSTGSEAASALA
jgi:hypothetical protein